MYIGLLFIIAFFLVMIFEPSNGYIKTGNLYINEILSSNKYTYKDDNGEYSDYIEIYNGNSYDINLENYYLTDSLYKKNKWTFPDITIKSHEYMLVFASGKNRCKENICHTSFKLNKAGETLSLVDKTGNIISQVKYPEMMNDTSYSLIGNKYSLTVPTPKEKNKKEEVKEIDTKKYKITINEYMSHNKGSTYANNGGYYDWVELYNASDENLDLQGLAISDDVTNLNKFILPSKILQAHGYIVIYLTGGKEVDGIYANFKLSDNDEKIILSANGKVIDEVEVIPLEKNVSYGKKDDKWYYFYTPTPGVANTTSGKEAIG